MNTTLSGFSVLVALLGASCAGVASADSAPSKALFSGAMSAGDTVYVRNVNGNITVTPSKGERVEVRARTKGGATVEVKEHAGGVTVCGIPKSRRATCGPKGDLDVDGSIGGDSVAHLEIAVPAGAVVDVSTVNGELVVQAGGRARAETVNGSIDVAARGPVEGATVNGRIDADLAKLAPGADVRLSSVNGSIKVSLPTRVDADVRADVVHGQIETRRKLADADASRWELRGRLGNGGRRIDLETVNGSIEIR